MTTKVSYCKNTTYPVMCFVKSLPWLFNRNLLTDIKISFYRNIVCRNVSCELGLTQLSVSIYNFLAKESSVKASSKILLKLAIGDKFINILQGAGFLLQKFYALLFFT